MKLNILLIALILSSVISCRQATHEATQEINRVRVTEISHEKIRFPIQASGLVVSEREVKLSFKTGGIIKALYADEGTRVKKGALLAILDLSEIEAQVTQSATGYNKAVRDYNRAKNLYTDSVVTLEQLQNAESVVNAAKANMEAITFNMNHSKIFAPDNGVILKRLVQSDEIITPGYPVFLFGTKGRYWKIRTGLADKDYVKIMPGDSAKVTLDAYPGVSFYAVVSQLGESANPLTGTYEVELDLESANHRLANGFVANLEILPAQAEVFYRIPVEALVEADGKTGFVFTLTDSLIAKKIKVNIAGITGSWVAVTDGLETINSLVTEGAAYLKEGDKVTIVK